MNSIEMIGVTCDKCDCYYFTTTNSHKSKCPSCNNEVKLLICKKEVCIGCDKTNICSAYRDAMEDII